MPSEDEEIRATHILAVFAIVAVPIEKVMGRQKLVPRDSPLIEAALSIGASLGVDL